MTTELVRKQFTFYASYYRAVRPLPDAQRLAAYDAIADYAFCLSEPEQGEGTVGSIFALIQPTLDAAHRRARKYRGRESDCGATDLPAPQEEDGAANNCLHENEKENEIEKENEEDSHCCAGAFEAFWELYPRKVGRYDARRAWNSHVRNANKVMERLRAWMDSENWAREGGRFIPKPAAFLRDGRYAKLPDAPQKRTLDSDERASILRMMKEDFDEEE